MPTGWLRSFKALIHSLLCKAQFLKKLLDQNLISDNKSYLCILYISFSLCLYFLWLLYLLLFILVYTLFCFIFCMYVN